MAGPSGQTPQLQLPYPIPDDNVDVPRDIQALADKLDTYFIGVRPPTAVAALPSNPSDGQECYFIADTTDGVVWHLRYRAANPTAFKWEFVGGAPLQVQPADNYTPPTGGVWFDPPNTTITIPLKGVYDFAYGAQPNGLPAGGFIWYVNLFFDGDVGVGTHGLNMGGPGSAPATFAMSLMSAGRATVPTAGSIVRMKCQVSGQAGSFSGRWMTAKPVRVG